MILSTIIHDISNINRCPAFEVSRTQYSGQPASPKGETAGLSIGSGAPQMQDIL